ncbi:hypothetical protein [Anaeroselena agilis]|uniref:Uncharacterized protein n=1 Tax=Anaeroselena agilis TaxID=3063788 RepID=A0ABU3NSN9_9FIRM|nr:hypothetical protein [Selenomonadales bacterium 4137-cl]
MLISYRHYTTAAMVDVLTMENVYFSRGNFVDQGRLHRPDTVSLRIEKCGNIGGGTVVIDCEVYNRVESIEDILNKKGFAKDEAAGKRFKQWHFSFQRTIDAGKLAGMVMAQINEAVEDMPLLMYASPAQRALADYYGFMTSSRPKIRYSDVMQHLGYWDDGKLYELDAYADDADREFFVAKYKRGRWTAWASGDLLMPLFASESEAKQYLSTRIKRVCQFRPTIATVAQAPKGCMPSVYALVDQTKNVKERMAWLRCELDRLEAQSETYCS